MWTSCWRSSGRAGKPPEGASGGLDHLVRAQTPRAHTNASDAAVNHGAHALKVGFEAPRPHVVGMADDPADNRRLSTDFTALSHLDHLVATHFIAKNI